MCQSRIYFKYTWLKSHLVLHSEPPKTVFSVVFINHRMQLGSEVGGKGLQNYIHL